MQRVTETIKEALLWPLAQLSPSKHPVIKATGHSLWPFPSTWQRTLIRISSCGSAETNLTSIHEEVGLIPGPASAVGIQCYRELWCRLQMRLRSCMASGCSSDSAPGLGTSICCECGPKKKRKKNLKRPLFMNCPGPHATSSRSVLSFPASR